MSPLYGHGFVLHHARDVGCIGNSSEAPQGEPRVQRKMDWDKELESLRVRSSENPGSRDRRLIDITINIGYTENLDRVVSIIKRVLRETDHIIKDPEPEMGVGDMDPSNIQIHVKPWCSKDGYWEAMSNLVRNLKMTLFKEGITYRSVRSNA